jgi:predicted membrane protein
MSNRSIIGLLLIVLGAAFILNNYFDIFDSFGSWWPLLLILIGLVQLLKRASSVFGGLLLIAVGLLFLGKNLNFIPGRLIFPLILICIGLFFIFSRIGGTRQENADYIRYFTLFSGLETNNQSQNFKGGSVAAVFGGSEIDLREARLSDQGAVLELTAMFGGVDLIVPKHWKVEVSGMPIFGGWENKAVYEGGSADDHVQVLKVNCTAVFGGITIRN